MIPESLSPLANHLWQSTLFAGVAGLLTLALRKNPARVRHWVWVVASLKFLVPFSVLITLGSHVQWRTVSVPTQTNFSIALDQISQPFTAPAISASSFKIVPVRASTLPAILFGIWACGFIGISISWWLHWRRIKGAVHAGSPVQLGLPIRAISSPSFLEPGIFGVFRPVLLLPEGIFEHLTPEQWKTVVAHELCHVRHRDNLIGIVQMFVETIFWFHPLVWWIGKRIFHERERACDEEVLRVFGEPKVYAEGILNVCKLYVESPLLCVSGVTGSNLKKRIEAIMTNRISEKLSFSNKLLLTVGGVLAVAGPMLLGVVNPTHLNAQSATAAKPSFAVASIKPSNSADQRLRTKILPQQVTVSNVTVKKLIEIAYNLKDFQISGGPSWMDSALFDIDARPEGIGNPGLMLQSLLAERFQLVVRHDTKELPVYALVVAKNGPKFKDAHESDPNIPELNGRSDIPAGSRMRVNIVRRGRLTTQGSDMTTLASQLSRFLGRTVVDKTGLKGSYDLKLEWAPDEIQVANFQDLGVPEGAGAPPADWRGPTLFTALEEQLGLKLDSQKGSVEVLVVERVEKPSEN